MEFRVGTLVLSPQGHAVLSGAVMLFLAIVSQGAAEERVHDAHVHGVSRLNIAIEGNTVEMELLSPGANIVGFEHKAESAEDKALVARAAAVLHDGEKLFAFPSGAECRLQTAKVESALIEEDSALATPPTTYRGKATGKSPPGPRSRGPFRCRSGIRIGDSESSEQIGTTSFTFDLAGSGRWSSPKGGRSRTCSTRSWALMLPLH